MERDSEGFIKLLINNEDWLIKRILNYAKKQDYTRYTSTLHKAWRLSISGLTESLILQVKASGLRSPELHADKDYSSNPLAAFGIMEAKKHRSRGVTLNMFLGLMKYYRQSYIDLIDTPKYDHKKKQLIRLFMIRCFDNIELGYIKEWTDLPMDNKLEELQNTNRDITNEKNKYLTVFESLITPIILLDENNVIINFNLAASKLFTDIEVAGTLYYNENISSCTLREISDTVNELINCSGEKVSFEIYLDTNEGKRFFQVTLRKMLDVSEKYKGTVIMLDDLTNRKQAEQILQEAKLKAEDADKLKTAFLANMSHEIRTPMNAILGFTELILASDPPKKERVEYLNLIRKSSNSLLTIIEDIIDIAKIESNQIKIHMKICKPVEILNDLYLLFKEMLKNYGSGEDIELRINVAISDLNIKFYTDADRLRQIISNLLNNAVKFTDFGFIEFGFKKVDQNHILFFVRDSGPGINDEMKDKIFERFIQIENTNSLKQNGAGLGLPICKNLVNLLGGSIWIESVVDKGSDFYFQLPLNEIKDEEEIKPVIRKIDESPHDYVWNEKHILIAEDDDSNYLFLSRLIGQYGAETLRAKNGLEAINIAESEENLDLILMDIKMPEINGLEAAKYISAIRPEIPIIAQTAFAMDGDKAECLKVGCCEYISKPIEKQNLLFLLEKHLSFKKKINLKSHSIK